MAMYEDENVKPNKRHGPPFVQLADGLSYVSKLHYYYGIFCPRDKADAQNDRFAWLEAVFGDRHNLISAYSLPFLSYGDWIISSPYLLPNNLAQHKNYYLNYKFIHYQI